MFRDRGERAVVHRMLRHLVEIVSPTETDDGAGGRTRTWPTSGRLAWADVLALSSTESSIVPGLSRARDAYWVTMRRTEAPSREDRLRVRDPLGPWLEVMGVRTIDHQQQWVEIEAMVVT